MATEKQIAANRANAKRSTGPKTAAGRARSSRNSYKHGLSGDLPLRHPMFRAKMDLIMQGLLEGNEPTDENLAAAEEMAEFHVKLMEIGRVRNEIWKNMPLQLQDWKDFVQFAQLDRYAHRAHTKRRRASQRFTAVEKEEEW